MSFQKKLFFIILGLFFNLFISQVQAADSFQGMNCDKLISLSKDEDFSLKNLAGLYAGRNCKDFQFNFELLSSQERQIFKVKFEEVNNEKKLNLTESINLDSLKKKYKNEKNIIEKYSLFKIIRQKHKENGNRKEGLKLIRSFHKEIFNLVNKIKKAKSNDPDLFLILNEMTAIQAKNLWNDDKIKQAETELNKTVLILKDKFAIYNLYFLLAKIQEDQLLIDSAVKSYDLSIDDFESKKSNAIPYDKAKVLWNKAWLQYTNDSPEKAAMSLKNLADQTTDRSEKSRSLFFLSKVYKKMNKSEDSKKALEDNIQNDFFSFYALASYYELGLKIPAVKKTLIDESFNYKSNLDFLELKNRNLFIDLVEYNEPEMADRAATVLTKNNNDYVKLGLYLAHHLKYYMPLFIGYAKSSLEEKLDIFKKHSQLLFPEVHAEKVTEMSEKTNVSKSLIYAIMKQESGFNPESRSPANALGLMQVIPPLAKSLSKKYKISNYKKSEDLFNPMTNIELGIYELKDQIEKQNGQLSFVASAYNAGPNAVKRWRNREPIKDMFEFIEDIPYDETRTYVKIIARNMLFYQRLAKPDLDHPFPEDFIKLVDTVY